MIKLVVALLIGLAAGYAVGYTDSQAGKPSIMARALDKFGASRMKNAELERQKREKDASAP
jgi:hypothetical protein